MSGRRTATLLALALVACGEAREPVSLPQRGIPINPLSLALTVGDSAAVGFMPEPGARITVTSSDPGVAEPSTADATAERAVYVRGKSVGSATLTVTFAGRQTITGSVAVTVQPRPSVPAGQAGLRLEVSPPAVTMEPNASVPLTVSLRRGDSVLTRDPRTFTFRSTDSCVAHVTPEGRVSGGRHGVATIIVATRDLVHVANVPATIRSPAVLRATIQSITTGTPATPVDPSAVRGTVTVTVKVDESLLPGRVELALAGRLVEARDVAGQGVEQFAFPVNTAARDPATGAPLYPNGFQHLALTVTTRRSPVVPGCPEELDRQTVTQVVTLANPTSAAARGP